MVVGRHASEHSGRWLLYGLLGVLLLAPLPLGSNRPVFWLLLVVMLNVLLLVQQLQVGLRREGKYGRVPGVPALLIFLFVHVIQLLSLGWGGSGMQTNDPSSTLHVLLQWEAFLVFYFLLTSELRRSHLDGQVIAAVIGLSTILSAFSLLNVMLQGVLWPFVAPSYGYTAASGTFVNPNHFATFLILSAPLAVGKLVLGLARERELASHIDRRPVVGTLALFLAEPMRVLIVLVIIAALMATASRGAIAAFLLSGVLVLMLFPGAMNAKLKSLALLLLLSFVAVFLAQGLGFGGLERKLLHPGGILVRLELWKDTLPLIEEHWLFGAGGGTYRWVFPEFKQTGLGLWIFDHAHNEYLEWLADYGVIGMLSLMAFWIIVLHRGISLLAAKRSSMRRLGMSPFLLWSFLAALLHSAVEFGLHMPANMLLMLVVCALIVRRSEHVASR